MKKFYVFNAAMLSGLLLTFATLNAYGATVLIPKQSSGSTTKSPNLSAPSRSQGTIENIDLGANAMVIGGTPYVFQASSTKVYSAANNVANVNPLSLKPGMPIQFKTVQEPGSARPRITEIWIGPTTGGKK
jgi:hypothetical protein